jgi:hypothetical protein
MNIQNLDAKQKPLVPFILDFDGAVTKQAQVVKRVDGQIIDVRDAERHLRGAHTAESAFWVTKFGNIRFTWITKGIIKPTICINHNETFEHR